MKQAHNLPDLNGSDAPNCETPGLFSLSIIGTELDETIGYQYHDFS
jgi:hypothetical protein